jgi:hypothetical protein
MVVAKTREATMTALILRATANLNISETIPMLSLFCLLGLTLSTAILPHIPSNELGWVITHLE